jgi:hypothetical protein
MASPLWQHPAFVDIYSQPFSESSFDTVSTAERFVSGRLDAGVAMLRGGLSTLTALVPGAARVQASLEALRAVHSLGGLISDVVGRGDVAAASAAAPLSALQSALELVLSSLQRAEASELAVAEDDSAVAGACAALRGGIALASELPVGTSDPRRAVDFVSALVARIEQLPVRGSLLIPAGWLGEEEERAQTNILLLGVARRADGQFDVWVCNTGGGLEYHAARAEGVRYRGGGHGRAQDTAA